MLYLGAIYFADVLQKEGMETMVQLLIIPMSKGVHTDSYEEKVNMMNVSGGSN